TRRVRAAGGVVEERAGAIDVRTVIEVAGEDVHLFRPGDVIVDAGPLRAGREVDFERAAGAFTPDLPHANAVARRALLDQRPRHHAADVRRLGGDESERLL